MRDRALTVATVLLLWAAPSHAQILSDRPCAPPRAPGEVVAAWRDEASGYGAWLTAERVARVQARWECRRIEYRSDDSLRVVGFLYRPTTPDGRLPAIVVNRGGTGDFGKMHDRLQPYYYGYLDAGYILLMPQYRGVDGGEGRDEYGGADTADVSGIVRVARALPYVDPDRLFMLGFSRGGLMTYRALAMRLPVRAAATISGLTDLEALTRYRPVMRDSVFRLLWPDYDTRSAEHYRVRSAARWPERISTPLLLVHGTADSSVRADDALALARGLQEHGRRYELVIYDGDTHGVPAHKQEVDRRVMAWFRAHDVPGPH